eukprot:CAMPEP_0180167908 /NCGR_PEP_ID=MMETSP0986-20121125/32386_1 /TAXON_ID=697907 /ORGANISM="non described non described, Strain CCMP2293" /LENGTH=259 /DNA_ID=CAMNT_0022119247 /DNA_START=12 /DNA_END=788 /DNA_ORIENTATION=-
MATTSLEEASTRSDPSLMTFNTLSGAWESVSSQLAEGLVRADLTHFSLWAPGTVTITPVIPPETSPAPEIVINAPITGGEGGDGGTPSDGEDLDAVGRGVGAIVGIIVGGLFAIGIGVLAFVLYRRGRLKNLFQRVSTAASFTGAGGLREPLVPHPADNLDSPRDGEVGDDRDRDTEHRSLAPTGSETLVEPMDSVEGGSSVSLHEGWSLEEDKDKESRARSGPEEPMDRISPSLEIPGATPPTPSGVAAEAALSAALS